MSQKQSAEQKENRHPTGQRGVGSDTHSPLFPLENKERKLLLFLHQTQNNRFNVKAYARDNSIPRSTVYDILNRLQRKKYAIKDGIANYVITQEGQVYLGVSEGCRGGVGIARRGCREGGPEKDLSLHYVRYIMPIKDKRSYNETRISELHPWNYKEVDLGNFRQHIIYFEDATIIINPHQVAIRIQDININDTEEGHFQSLSRALHYVEKVKSIGIKGDNIKLENAHYARVESLMADTLKKIDNRFFLDLGNGKKFWIDHSKGKQEDETNDYQSRERLDNWLHDMFNSDSLMSDVDKMKDVLGHLVKLRMLEMRPTPSDTHHLPISKSHYIG